MSMKRIFSLVVVMAMFGLPAYAQKDENNRIRNAGKVMVEILNVPDDIPAELLEKAECVIVLPSVMKAAFIVGGSYGRGVMSCRSGPDFNGHWSAPAMMALEGASVGFQIGGQATDFVLLVMNKRGANSILTSQVKLGGDIAAAAGPKGRNAAASTDVTARARIRKNFCSHGDIRGGRSIAALRSRSSSYVAAELDLAGEDRISPALIHYQQDEVGGLAANLKANACALKCHHRRRAPRPVEIRPAPAGHQTSAIAAADDEGCLHD